MTRDPICYADINEADARKDGLFSDYNGQTFFFCSRACKDRFDRDPGAFMRTPPWEDENRERPDNFIG